MDMVWNIFFMFGGVAVMMLGMTLMGNGLEKFAGSKMKAMLSKATSNRFAGIGVGVAVTSIIQSSTATTVMLVGFVNIGLLSLSQAVGIIMGANIGTTVTAHIVSLSSIGAIDIGAIAALIGCVGVLMQMLINNEKVKNIGAILGGLGVLFVGLEVISLFAGQVMFQNINGEKVPYDWVKVILLQDHSPILLIIIGIVLTALVHSSSTITSLMVVLASMGGLPFSNALFLALGSNIGTCITAILSSAGTSVNARRTALVHLGFNTAGCLIVLAPLWIFKAEITAFFASISGDIGQQVAIFHTMFNLLVTLILLPFTNLIVKLVCKIIPEVKQEEDEKKLAYLDNLMLQTPPIAVGNIRKEIVRMAEFAKRNLNYSMEMLFYTDKDYSKKIAENEEVLNYLNRSITAFMTKLIGKDLSIEDDKKISSYFHVVSDLERVGDYAENIMEYSFRLRKEDLCFSGDAREELQDTLDKINQLFSVSISIFDNRDLSLIDEVDALEQKVDDIAVELEAKHIERIKKGTCNAQIGSIYLQTVSNLERVGDHVTNIAFSVKHYRHVDKKKA